MKGPCCECGVQLPAESRVDTALICSECLEEQRTASTAWSIAMALDGLDESQLGYVRKLVDHLGGTNSDSAFASIGIKSK